MQDLLLKLAAPLIPLLAGLIATKLFDHVDDVLKWTAKLPDAAKQALVAALAVLIPQLNAKYGLQLPSDVAGLLSEPALQSVVAAVLAFVLKGSKKAPPAPAVPSAPAKP